MSIYDSKPRKTYAVGATAQNVFAVPFVFWAASDIKVYVDDVRLTSGYTVSGGNGQGGSVTLATPVSNTAVAIVRRLKIERTTDFPAAGALKTAALNRQLDQHTAILQQLDDDNARSLMLPENDDALGSPLPTLAQRANRVLGFDAAGKPIVSTISVQQLDALTLAALQAGKVAEVIEPFEADGVASTITTRAPLVAAAQVTLLIGGIVQRPESGAYTVSGTTITLAEPPPAGVVVGGFVGYATEVAGAALTAIQGTTPAADRIVFFTGEATADTTAFTSFARSLLAGASAVAMRSTLGALATNGDGSAVTVTTTGGAPATRTTADRAEDYVSKNTSLTSRVTVGAAQAATSTTITLDDGNQAIDDVYNGLNVVITGGAGAGQTRLITDYVGSTRVATVSTAWTTTPDATSTYDIRIPAGSSGKGQRWRQIVKGWTSNIGNGGGGRWVTEFDTSASGDWSSSQEVSSQSINTGPSMNGNDGETYLYQQVVLIVSDNNLRNPPTPQNSDVVSGASKTGTSASPLDVGPQFVLHREVDNPPAGSALAQFMGTGKDDAGGTVRYGETVVEVRDPSAANPKGRVRTQVATAPTFGGGSKVGWTVGSDGCTTWKPSGGADTQPTGGEKGEGTINAFELYDNGSRVAVTSGSNQAILTTTGATNVTLPTAGTLATLAGAETFSNKVLSNAVASGNFTVGTTSGAAAMFSGGDSNFYIQNTAAGNIIFRTNNGTAQARAIHTASANRTFDFSGSNGGNPSIGASAGALAVSSVLALKTYTVATLPTAVAGGVIYVSDGTSNKRLAVSDGTNWRWPDGAIVS